MSRRRTDPTPRKPVPPITFGKADRKRMRLAYVAHMQKRGLPIPKHYFTDKTKTQNTP